MKACYIVICITIIVIILVVLFAVFYRQRDFFTYANLIIPNTTMSIPEFMSAMQTSHLTSCDRIWPANAPLPLSVINDPSSLEKPSLGTYEFIIRCLSASYNLAEKCDSVDWSIANWICNVEHIYTILPAKFDKDPVGFIGKISFDNTVSQCSPPSKSPKGSSTDILLVVIRGTEEVEWLEEAEMVLVKSPIPGSKGRVEKGFAEIYNQIIGQIAKYGQDYSKILVCGHSLGAALTTLVAASLAVTNTDKQIYAYPVACPQPGDQEFAEWYYDLTTKNLKSTVINNTADAVPGIPLYDWGYRPVNNEIRFTLDTGVLLHNHLLTTYLAGAHKLFGDPN
jgi:hypothetical protein